MKHFFFKTAVLGLCLFGGFASSVFAQGGIEFQSGTWAEIQARAAQENKIIFVDAYTDWCGPCKWLAANIFTKAEVGEFFNRTFVCYKIDAEKGEGPEFAKRYGVSAYPTLLYINSTGELAHKTIGSMDEKRLLDAAAAATDPNRQAYGLLRRYEKGEREPEMLLACAGALLAAGEADKGTEVALEYLNRIPKEKWSEKDVFNLIVKTPTKPSESHFQYILANQTAFEQATQAPDVVKAYIDNVFLRPALAAARQKDPKALDAAQSDIKTYAGKQTPRLSAYADYLFYAGMGYEVKTFSYVIKYVDNYVNDCLELNQIAWQAQEQITDKKCLLKILEWAKKSVALDRRYFNLDTQAWILYKLKRYKESLAVAQEAIELMQSEGIKQYSTSELIQKLETAMKQK